MNNFTTNVRERIKNMKKPKLKSKSHGKGKGNDI